MDLFEARLYADIQTPHHRHVRNALTGYPVTRLDVGLSTYRRVAAEDSATPSQRAILMRLITLSVSLPHTVCWVSDNPRPSGPPSIGALKFYVEKYVY